jgi:hypothetical protein
MAKPLRVVKEAVAGGPWLVVSARNGEIAILLV